MVGVNLGELLFTLEKYRTGICDYVLFLELCFLFLTLKLRLATVFLETWEGDNWSGSLLSTSEEVRIGSLCVLIVRT